MAQLQPPPFPLEETVDLFELLEAVRRDPQVDPRLLAPLTDFALSLLTTPEQ